MVVKAGQNTISIKIKLITAIQPSFLAPGSTESLWTP